jgi:hypothetical protein
MWVPFGFTKWGGSRHWTAPSLVWLGEDEFGWWLGDRAGAQWQRGDGRTFTSPTNDVLLVPRDRAHTVMFYERHPEWEYRLYVDITTVAEWTTDGGLTATDLDLDVVEYWDGRTSVLDEDEFAEHQVKYGYPADLIAAAEAECARVHDELRSGAPQFAMEHADRWRLVLPDLDLT